MRLRPGNGTNAGAGKGWSLGKEFVPRDVCIICAKSFYCPPSRKRKAVKVYCSTICRGQAKRKPEAARPRGTSVLRSRAAKQISFRGNTFRPRPPKEMIALKCIACAKDFSVRVSVFKNDNSKYCSRRCFWIHNPLNQAKPYTSGKGGKREDLGGAYFRSRWEANWARYLNWRKERLEIKDWKFEAKTFEFPVKRGSRFYTPDFQIWSNEGEAYYEEVKGYMDPKSATKLKRMAKYFPDIKIEVIDSRIYRSAHKQLAGLIPGWEAPGSKHSY